MTLLKDQQHVTTHRGADNRILKTAKNDTGMQHLSNETAYLAMMATSGYVSKVLDYLGTEEAPTSIFLEDLGDTEPVTDNDVALTHAIHLLGHLHQRGIWHGDLTAPNIIIRDNKPHAIDFGESMFLDAAKMNVHPKRPEPDWFHLLQAIQRHGDPRRIIRRWLAMRDTFGVGHTMEGTSLIDFGCNEGYMVALAAADGAKAQGWDFDQIVCANARTRWAELPMAVDQFHLTFMHQNIEHIKRHEGRYNIALCLSVYPYLIQQLGEEESRWVLAKMVSSYDMVFFEAQSAGDGPGPAFWPNQNAVGEYLTVFGHVEEVCRLKIAGRDSERVTWKVTKN